MRRTERRLERRGRGEELLMRGLRLLTDRLVGHFPRVAIETTDIESIKAPMKTWRKKRAETVFMQNVNGSQSKTDEDQAEPGFEMVGIEVCEDGSWVDCVVVLIVYCLSQADAVKDAVNIVW